MNEKHYILSVSIHINNWIDMMVKDNINSCSYENTQQNKFIA